MDTSSISLAAVLLASLLGSPHCAGMCGGFVAFYSGKAKGSLWPHLSYHAGRLLTYALLGASVGLLGQSLDYWGELAGVQRITLIITGVLLIYWGVRELTGKSILFAGAPPQGLVFKGLSRAFRRIFKESEQANWTARSFLIGTLSTFLPCGWLHTFTLVAAASGSPSRGALIMGAFWLGTVPVLATVGGVANVLASRFRAYVPRITACLLITAGLFSLFGRFDKLFLSQGSAQETQCQHQTVLEDPADN